MTHGQHIMEVAKSHTIEELWGMFDSETGIIAKLNLKAAIMHKLKVVDFRLAEASRK